MDSRPAIESAMDAFAVPITFKTELAAAISTTGIWLSPELEDLPVGRDFAAREPRQRMALSREDVSKIPKGAVINAAPMDGGAAVDWQVDQVEFTEADHFRVMLVRKHV